MQASRRGFLQAFAAAPAAAVAVKNSLSEVVTRYGAFDAASRLGGEAAGYATGAIPQTKQPWDENQWLQERLANLTKQVLKIETDPEPGYAPDMLVASANVDTLRSVSAAVKLQMARKEVGLKQAARQKINLLDEIGQIKKQLGILGVFL